VVQVANVVSGVTFDCVDPARVARFWSVLTGREPGPSADRWVYLGHRGDLQPRLVFQPVPQPKTGKVRIDLDITVDDIDEAAALVTVPEDHEFCLVQYY
jgi:Glyoxalase-like domain